MTARLVGSLAWGTALGLACSIVGCSALIAPDTTQLREDTGLGASMDGAVVRLDAGPGVDAVVVDDAVAPGTDAWVAPGDDAWVAPTDDAWVQPNDAWVPPPVCVAGDECIGYSDVLARSPTGAAGSTPGAALMNCVIQMHQLDCCGARAAYGVNHGARPGLCSAERSCTAMYPTPAPCSDNTIVTDTGETTTNPNDVRIRVVDPQSCSFGTCYTCETFVCMSDTCRSLPGISGGCGP